MLLTIGFSTIKKTENIMELSKEDLKHWDFENKRVFEYEVTDSYLFFNVIEDLKIQTYKIIKEKNNKKIEFLCYEFLCQAFEFLCYGMNYNIENDLSNYYKSQIIQNKVFKHNIINCFPYIEASWHKPKETIEHFAFRVSSFSDVLQSWKFEKSLLANCEVAKKDEKYIIYLYGCDDASYTKIVDSEEEALDIIKMIKTEYKIDTARLVKELNFIFTN